MPLTPTADGPDNSVMAGVLPLLGHAAIACLVAGNTIAPLTLWEGYAPLLREHARRLRAAADLLDPPAPSPVEGEDIAQLRKRAVASAKWRVEDGTTTSVSALDMAKYILALSTSIAPVPGDAGDLAGQGEPVAWAYEELKTRTFDAWEPALSYGQPEPASYHRNIRPLYEAALRPAPTAEDIAAAHAEAVQHTDWWQIPFENWKQISDEYAPALAAALFHNPNRDEAPCK